MALAEKTVTDLEILLNRYSEQRFLLNHVGQASPEVVQKLIKNHNNIYFYRRRPLDDFKLPQTRKNRELKVRKLDGFHFLKLIIRQDLLSNPKWVLEWRRLVETYPTRFIINYDLVFTRNWERKIRQDVKIWRKALGLIDQKSPNDCM